MVRRRPLVMNGGVIERLQVGDLLNFGKLNLGFIQPLPVISNNITVTASLHQLTSGGDFFITNISGGDEGDIIVILGPTSGSKFLTGTGNYDGQSCFFNTPSRIAVFVYTGSIWHLVTRNF